MTTLSLLIILFLGYILFYKIYGNFLGKKIFTITSNKDVPAKKYEDGEEFIPTDKDVAFGHHYTSIAGAGPIIGPAIAVIWGWLPAILWVFFGSIFLGAIHDLGSLYISLKNDGKSIIEYFDKFLGKKIKIFLLLILFLDLLMVLSIFSFVIASILKLYPETVIAVWSEIPIAILLGYLVFVKKKDASILSMLSIILMYIVVFLGVHNPFSLNLFGFGEINSWVFLLLIYAFFASLIPRKILWEPRDFINSHELFLVAFLLILGIFASAFTDTLHLSSAPMINLDISALPKIFPFLFVTIACGAISGFHSLVASGSTVKHISNEKDSLFIGFGSMLMESGLAILVIIAVTAGLGMGVKVGDKIFSEASAWNHYYSSWSDYSLIENLSGLELRLAAFIRGSANIISALGLPLKWGTAIMGVFVATFAGTTLDTATRTQRLIVKHIFPKSKILQKDTIATLFSLFFVFLILINLLHNKENSLDLWLLFGIINQGLAAIVLFLISLYLYRKAFYKSIFAFLPALFMSFITFWASYENIQNLLSKNSYLLAFINFTFFISLSIIIGKSLILHIRKYK